MKLAPSPAHVERSLRSLLVAISFALSTGGGLSAPAALAQGIPVFSGEHDGFTRIVVDFSRPTDWRIAREPDGYRVTFSPAPRQFDLSRVFDLIPRDRLERITQSPTDGSLFLYSSCDCVMEAFDAGSDAVALDIKDAPDRGSVDRAGPVLPAGLTVETTASLQPLSVPFPAYPASRRTPPAARETAAPGQLQEAPGDRPSPPFGQGEADAGSADPHGQSTLPQGLPEEIRARALAHALSEDLARAAAAGLIDIPDMERPDRDREGSPLVAKDPGDALPHVQMDLEPRENLRFRTAHDIWSDAALEIFGREEICQSPGAFDFLAAAEPRRLFWRLPDLRASLVDARGSVSASGARALAEAYLALGFGAEAALVLRDASLPGVWASRFESLARIMDLGGDASEAAWSGATACPSPIAMWAVLGQAPGLTTDAVDAEAVQSAFFDLPGHLRIHLAENLAERMRSAGHPAAADAIVANANLLRVRPPSPAEAGEAGSPALPERAFSAEPAITPGSQELQVRDLLARIAEALDDDLAPREEDLDLAEAMLTEYRGIEEGRRLADALAIRHMRNGDFEAVLERLSLPRARENRDWMARIERGLASALAAQPISALLGVTLHPRAAELLGLLSDDQGTRAAERLIDAGFPQFAAQLLSLSGGRDTDSTRMITARAELEAGDAARALALLAGLAEPPAAALRARALAALGNHGGAAEAFAAAGDRRNASRSAWLSGDPALIARFGTPDQRDAMTRLGRLDEGTSGGAEQPPRADENAAGAPLQDSDPPLQDSDPPEAPPPGSLAAAAALLERSGERRAALLEVIGTLR